MSFIQKLHEKRSNYSNPEQATMQENSLEKLSSGIYTEGERFIFELLQNAVDAHSGNDCLDISISLQGGYLVFMHNGDPFTDEDIEGLCFVGRKGEKVRNAKKIGYKGIGFKSVFGISSKVYIHTGDQCFRFDREYWRAYWNEHWNSSLEPKPADVSEYTMPWQVIPIESEVPIDLNEGNANVATYIAIDPEDEAKLAESVQGLMESCRFLIFLKDRNIKMSFTYHGNTQCTIEKCFQDEEVVLYVNGKEDSRWMVYQNQEVPLNLTMEQRRRIEKHKSTPDKLKNATSFDLSFAIALEDGKLKKAERAVVYTYLPTSYSFGKDFPFLVNANFITDEGRQHLDVDAEWNKVLISKIPEEYLKWVASFSKKHPNYYEVLPKKSYGSGNEMLKSYEDAMKDVIAKIAFIPSVRCADLLKAKDALIDRIGLTTQITSSILIEHVNRKNGTAFNINSIAANEGVAVFRSYGVTIFERDDLKDLFEDSNAFDHLTPEEDAQLVKFLHEYYFANKTEQDALLEILSSTKFLFDTNGILRTPSELQFPSGFKNEFSDDAFVLDETLYSMLGGLESTICCWLGKLGVREASDMSLIKQVVCRPGYITRDNALDVGRYLYRVYKRQNFFDEIPSYRFACVKLLTTKGELVDPMDAYLCSEYKPDVDLEPVYNEDIFVSAEYIEDENERDLYKAFFRKLGVSSSLELQWRKFYCSEDCDRVEHLQAIIKKSGQEFRSSSNTGKNYYFDPKCFSVVYAPLLSLDSDDYELSKLIWTVILKSPMKDHDDTIEGVFGLFYKALSYKSFSGGHSFLYDMIHKKQKLPASDGTMRLSRELFYHSEMNCSLAGPYLPIINIDCAIDESWEDTLQLKKDLKISDLLEVLNLISKDLGRLDENKARICKIYDRIVELGVNASSVQCAIQSWAQDAVVLSRDGRFVSPAELRYITLDGFSGLNQVYIGKPKDKGGVLNLMSLMGVKIITADNVTPTFEGDVLNTDIYTRLLSTLPALAVLARDCNNKRTYHQCKETLRQKIESTSFYQCESISLTYDDSDDTISKITFAQNGKFYFTGELRPAKLEPLLHPLCSYLEITGKERELFVIMTEPEFAGIIEYLEDKEYDVTDIENELLPANIVEGSNVSVGGRIGGGIDKLSQIAESSEAKRLVLAHLETLGFDISNAESEQSTIHGVTFGEVAYPLVVKSCKNFSRQLEVNPNEWKQLFKPNSMLWLHFGGEKIAPIKAYELFTYHDKLTISFDTINLMSDERVNKIMEVMHYFNNVHLDLTALNPNQQRGEELSDYLFNENNSSSSDIDDASSIL